MPRGSFNAAPVVSQPEAGAIVGSAEQEAVWRFLAQDARHLIIEAVAGSGKTFTIVEAARRDRERRIGLVAFNKHIATELSSRMGGQSNVECMTYHSLGFKTVKSSVRHNIRVDQYKVLGLLDNMSLPQSVKKDREKVFKYRVSSMVSYAKTYGHGKDVDRDELLRIADRHDVDMPDGLGEVVLDFVPVVLGKCMENLSTVDFDDMVWLPKVLGLSVSKYDLLFVDEYQDTGSTQQWLAVRGGDRICVVGDKKQAIYSFRGCDGKGFDALRTMYGAGIVTLPLTLTRRCPKLHVRLAQVLVPQIQALVDAPEGKVRVGVGVDQAVGEMAPGDLVVCRVNAELLGVAYKLLKRGVKAVVRGRDIGKGISKLIGEGEARLGNRKAGVDSDLADVLAACGEVTFQEVTKLNAIPQGRGEMRAANAVDKYDCLVELGVGVESVAELKSVLVRLFEDFETDGQPKNAVVLGTVHRTKGLEGNRVYVLRPDLMPHPMAKKEEDLQGEENLLYVAITRAKFERGVGDGVCGELVFCGPMPAILHGGGARRGLGPGVETGMEDRGLDRGVVEVLAAEEDVEADADGWE